MMPMNFVSLDDCHRRKLHPLKLISVRALFKKVTYTCLSILGAVTFVASSIGKNSHVYREAAQERQVNAVITREKLLITINSEPVAILSKKSDKRQFLREQVW